jgi:hypothetical protein
MVRVTPKDVKRGTREMAENIGRIQLIYTNNEELLLYST